MKKFLLIIILILIAAAPLWADRKLTIVRGQDFPPYHSLDKEGKETGFVVDIIDQVSKSMGKEIEYKQLPWTRCLFMVKSGQADAMMNLFKTDERQEFIYFGDNILSHEVNRFFKLESSPAYFSGDLASLADARFCAIRNYSYGKIFDRMTFSRMVRLETEKGLVLSLANKRCELILGNELVIEVLARQLSPQKKIIPLSPSITNDPLYIGFSKARGHKVLADQFSFQLKKFKTTPAYKDLLGAYKL